MSWDGGGGGKGYTSWNQDGGKGGSGWGGGGWKDDGGGGKWKGGGWKNDDKEGGGWQDEEKKRLGDKRAVGVLVDWQHKSGKSFGWIAPIYGIMGEPNETQGKHGGDVYVHWKDIQDPRPGAIVTFWPYVDSQGLGAENCVSRCVMRFIVPRASVSSLNTPRVEVNPCATYLTSSVFFPELEDKGVTMRKYLWDGPYAVFETWGSPQDLAQVCGDLGFLQHPEVEVLVSRNMVRQEEPSSVRQVPKEDLPHVPLRFQLALRLPNDKDDARERILSLCGS